MWEIIGHEAQLAKLSEAIESKRLHHAYLFTGPEQIGKFTLAREFAKKLQCANNGCGNCSSCNLIATDSHQDVLIFRDKVYEKVTDDNRKTETRNFLVSESREIVRRTSLSFTSPYLVIIIENIERMNLPSANALLKIIEEPPPNIIFILTSNNLLKVLPTLISRVHRIELNTISYEVLANYLRTKYQRETAERLEDILNLSLGKAGLAIEMVHDTDLFSYRLELFNRCQDFLTTSSLEKKFAYAEEITKIDKDSKKRNTTKDFLEMLTYYLKKGLEKLIDDNQVYPWHKFTPREIVNKIERTQACWEMIEQNVNQKLVLEHLFLHL